MMNIFSKESVYYRLKIEMKIRFVTAFHLGSGMEGEAGSDNGIMTDPNNMPFLPGSSIKGIFRSTVERLVSALRMEKIWACGLQNGLYSTKPCIGGGVAKENKTYHEANKQYQESNGDDISLIEQNCCSVCQLFGSPLTAGRLYIDDAFLNNAEDFVLSKRDGVGINRDSGTSMDSVKYDYDVANTGLKYAISMEAQEVTEQEMGLIALGILEWKHAGIRIGGKTTRGLGHAVIEDISVSHIDLSRVDERKAYLLKGEMKRENNVDEFFQEKIDKIIA